MHNKLGRVVVVLWVLFCGTTVSQAGENPRSLAPAERTRRAPQLEIKTAHGTCLVRLSGEQDGPVRVPLSTGRYSAVLVSTQFIADKVYVKLAGEEVLLDGATVPLGQYEFSAKEPTVSWLPHELKANDVGILNMRLLPASALAICDGCDCGSLCCKPDAGHCIGCGSCGDCCRSQT